MAPHTEASNGNFRFLPLHLVEDILLRLNAQTLFQCSFVCRGWNNLITSPDFISRSSSITFGSRSQILLIKYCHFNESDGEYGRKDNFFPYSRLAYSLHWDNERFDLFRTVESPSMDGFRDTKVMGVSNGLICLAKRFPLEFILWNPTIRRYAWLPAMTWNGSLFSVGFGFDCGSNDFKVVNLIYHDLDWFHVAHGFVSAWVFSYATWSWKRLTSSILKLCSIHHRSLPVFFNGALHWIATHEEEDYDFILTFDLTREVFGKLLLPSGAIRYRSGPFMTAYNSIATTGDSLLFIQEKNVYESESESDDDESESESESESEYDEDENVRLSSCCTIWIMKQYGKHESWTKTSSAVMRNMIPGSVLGARKNGDIIFEMGISGETRRYDPSTSTNVPVEVMEDTVFFHYHTETLYLLEKAQHQVNSY